MAILITNDDGVGSDGLNILAETASYFDPEIYVIAPTSQKSGASISLTLFHSLKIRTFDAIAPVKKLIGVNGTPADCVKYALGHELRDKPVTLVLSGVNAGLNVGCAVNYSGTVGAAIEAAVMGVTSAAISVHVEDIMNNPVATDWTPLLTSLRSLVGRFYDYSQRQIENPELPVLCFNLNLPDQKPKGLKITHVSRTTFDTRFYPLPDQPDIFRVDGFFVANESDDDLTADYAAVKNHYISLTPLDLTRTNTSQLDNFTNLFSDWSVPPDSSGKK